jgi:hypothetical protein
MAIHSPVSTETIREFLISIPKRISIDIIFALSNLIPVVEDKFVGDQL